MIQTSPVILIADGTPSGRRELARMFTRLGHATARWNPERHDRMPESTGLVIVRVSGIPKDRWAALIREAATRAPGASLVALTARGDVHGTRRAFRLGVTDCIEEPFTESAASAMLDHLSHSRRDRGGAIRRGVDPTRVEDIAPWVDRMRRRLFDSRRDVTRALVAAVEARDPYTTRHSERVSEYATGIARRLGLPERRIATLRNAAILHDVGKVGVPDAILQKPGPLTPEEFDVIKRHPEIGARILDPVRHLGAEIPIILHHHERYDGTGYPFGVGGCDIPFGARILAVADALDAMRSRRSYKEPYAPRRVLDELRTASGRQFDPTVVDAAIAGEDG